MPDSFDRDATIKALPRIADGFWDFVADSGLASDETLTALDDLIRAARWAVQITEGDVELWRHKRCPTCLTLSPDARCVDRSRVRVWPPEAGE